MLAEKRAKLDAMKAKRLSNRTSTSSVVVGGGGGGKDGEAGEDLDGYIAGLIGDSSPSDDKDAVQEVPSTTPPPSPPEVVEVSKMVVVEKVVEVIKEVKLNVEQYDKSCQTDDTQSSEQDNGEDVGEDEGGGLRQGDRREPEGNLPRHPGRRQPHEGTEAAGKHRQHRQYRRQDG